MISYWLNYGFWFIEKYGSFQWRFPIAFQIVFAVILMIGILLFPESPRWLLKHGKNEEATEIMARLEDLPIDSEQIQSDIKEIQKINAQESSKLTWRELITNKTRGMNGWRFSAGCLSQAFQQIGTSYTKPPPTSSFTTTPLTIQLSQAGLTL